MMRLFVQHANRTVIVALRDGDTMADLMDKCSNKFGNDLPVSFRLCLDVDGHPIVEELGEVRDGDKICVKASETMTQTPPVSTSSSVVVEDEDEKEDDSEKEYDSEKDDSEEENSEKDDSEEEDSEEDDDSDDEYVEPTKKRARTEVRAPASPITLEAVMDKSVVPPTTTSSADAEIKERIRNILQRGLHPTTPEAEAANSMRLAERMLRKHNVSRSEVMMNAENASENGDMVKVHIRNPATKKPSTTKEWFHNLAHAIGKHFKCKYFFNVRMSVRCYFTFYGISSNVYAAAFAFETAFNRIMTLVSQHTVPAGEYERKRRNNEISVCRATYTKSARVSYCDGLAMGLYQRVKGFTESTHSRTEEVEYTVTAEEETRLACVTKKVEESILDKNKITFTKKKAHKYKSVQYRAESYAAGKRDSSHIDLQQRKLA